MLPLVASDVEDRRGAMLLDSSFCKMTVLIVMNDEPLLDSLKNMVREFGVLALLT